MAFSFREARGANTDISNTWRRGNPGHGGAPTSTGSWVPEEKQQQHLQTAALPAQRISSGKPTHLPPELGHPGPRQPSPTGLPPLFPVLTIQMLLAMFTIALRYTSFNHPVSHIQAKWVWFPWEGKVMETQCDLNFRSTYWNLDLCLSPATDLSLCTKKLNPS